jgi:D-glycero-D-manno-heptose 1,7-bisphosphate phosphatase
MDESAQMGRRFALLDRDGTVVIDKIYLSDAAGLEFAPGVIEGLRLMRDAGLRFIMVTNQSGIARGYFDEETLARIHRRLREMLAEEGIDLEAIYYCPHGPLDACPCRKPEPGLVLDAMADFGFSAAQAVLIGDSEADMGAAIAAGVRGIRVAPPNAGASAPPNAAPDFLMAARRAIDYFEARQPKKRSCT